MSIVHVHVRQKMSTRFPPPSSFRIDTIPHFPSSRRFSQLIHFVFFVPIIEAEPNDVEIRDAYKICEIKILPAHPREKPKSIYAVKMR